jgi:hypothetical protein
MRGGKHYENADSGKTKQKEEPRLYGNGYVRVQRVLGARRETDRQGRDHLFKVISLIQANNGKRQ